MAWLPSVKSVQEPVQKKTFIGGNSIREPYVAYNKDWSPSRALNDALKKVTWVYRCVDAIASNSARLPVVFREGDRWIGETREMEDLNRVFNKRSNPGEDSFLFRYRLSAQVLLSSKGVFIDIIRNNRDEIVALSLIPPDSVTPIPDANKFVKGYEVSYTDAQGRPKKVMKKPEDVIWIRHPHPFDPYSAMTPLESSGVAIETDWLSKMYNRNFLLNDGRPGGMVVIKGEVTQEDKEELRARFGGGVAGAGRITVVGSEDGADFVDTAVNPRDAQYIEGRKNTKEEILMAFGVPESVLANAAGRTFDNAEMERLIFWMETMMPHLELLMRPLDILDEEDELYFSFDLSMVDVLQRMELKRKEYGLREWDAGTISLDEYREITGREPIGGSLGRLMILPTTKAPYLTVDGEEIELPLIEREMSEIEEEVGGGNNPNGRPETGDVEEAPEEDEPREREDDRTAPLENEPQKSLEEGLDLLDGIKTVVVDTKTIGAYDIPTHKWIDFKGYIQDAYSTRASVKRSIDALFERQERVLSEKAAGNKMRKYMAKRQHLIEEKAHDAVSLADAVSNIYDREVWLKQLIDDVLPYVSGSYEDAARHVFEKAGVEYEDPVFIDPNFRKRMEAVIETVEMKVTSIVAASALTEDTPEEIAEKIKQEVASLGQTISDSVSESEIAMAIEAGRAYAAKTVGLEEYSRYPVENTNVIANIYTDGKSLVL